MDTGWRKIMVQAFAVIGVITVIGFAVFGLWRLLKRWPAGDNSATAETAAVSSAGVAASEKSSDEPPVSSTVLRPDVAKTKVYQREIKSPLPESAGGMADLTVRVVDIGIINPYTGEFAPSASIGRGEQAAIVFEVINIGTAVSERWQFAANIPTPGGPFTSEMQFPLAPREGLRSTIGFPELMREGANPVTISIIPWNPTKDGNQLNNAANVTLLRGY